MSSNFKMFDSETGEQVRLEAGEFRWRKEGLKIARETLYIPQFVGNGKARYEVGGVDTGVSAYPSGALLFPGEPAMSFGSMEEAKEYAEATMSCAGPSPRRAVRRCSIGRIATRRKGRASTPSGG